MTLLLQLAATVLALLARPSAGLDPRISFPSEFDCPLKQLALARATALLANASAHRRSASWQRVVFDALELGPRCGVPPPPVAAPPVAPAAANNAAVPADAIFVSTHGSDASGNGGHDAPFASLRRAQLQARLHGHHASTIVLRGGRYFMNETFVITAVDSGLSLVAYPGEVPVLFGGVALTGLLRWVLAGAPFHPSVRVASVAHLPQRAWDGMLANGQLLWRARFPDVPEFGRQLQPQGWVPVHGFTSRPVVQKGEDIVSAPCRNHSTMPCYSETIGGNGNRFANKRSFCDDSACDMGASSVTPDPNGWTQKTWDHPETGVAVYLNGPVSGDDAWFNWGSYITNVGVSNSSSDPCSGVPAVSFPPYLNVSRFDLKPQRIGVGTDLNASGFVCSQGGSTCVEEATKHCLTLDSCDGVGYSPDWDRKGEKYRLFTGGTMAPQECGNCEWNYWCRTDRPGRCGAPCASDGQQPMVHTINLGEGDWQAAVTPNTVKISMMYVDNILEELTAPGEWFLDVPNQRLYLYPNGTLDNSTELVASTLTSLIELRGGHATPVKDVTISGLTFTGTRPTFMERYSAVSSGDWAIFRGGCITTSDTEDFTLELSTFTSIFGNGVALLDRNTRATLQHNEFVHVGDSAMVAVGETSGIDGYSEPRSSNHTRVVGNIVHQIGLIGKQVKRFINHPFSTSHNLVSVR
jgi:hypothetical protein